VSVQAPANTWPRHKRYSETVLIGVDAAVWSNRRGYGRHARALLAAALQIDKRNRYIFYTDSEEGAALLPPGAELVRVRSASPASQAASSNGRRRIGDLWNMSRAITETAVDCLLFPTVYSYVPVLTRAYKMVVIHDIIPEKFSGYTFPTIAGRLNWNLKSWLARRQADLILTVSEYSRQAILELFGERPDRVQVVGEAGDPVFRMIENPVPTERLSALDIRAGDPLVLFVGGFSPHKNLSGLLDAFSSLAERRQDLRLVLAGDYEADAFHSCYREISERAAQPPLQNRVIFTGYLPDADLVQLMNLATVLALPSFMEGFGLPAVEAAACGLPVVATRESPLPELLGSGGIFIDPHDSDALRSALEKVLCDAALRRRMREHGARAAASLSWTRAARELISIFDRVEQNHAQAS